MPSINILQLDELLQPVTDDTPAGTDIRDAPSPTSPYSLIKDARSAARAAERQNLFDKDNSEAIEQWRKVAELAPDIIKNHAKDLEVASWLTEALVRRNGFQGLRDGFKLIHGLIDQYWDNLFPIPDEDGIETRVASLTGLNGEGAEGVLIAPIRNIEITESHDPGPFTYWQYQQVLELEKIADADARMEKASKLGYSNSDIETAVANSSTEFFVNLRDDITDAINTYRQTAALLDEHCGAHDAPPSSNIINILQESLGAINHIAKHKFPIEQDASEDEEAAASEGGETAAESATSSAGPVRNREDAFRKLIEISEFFRKTEPHSPVSYMLQRTVKWGSMPLEDLIRELIPDSSARDFYGSLTGVVVSDDD
jgi:type VI secretion system protein ImpA